MVKKTGANKLPVVRKFRAINTTRQTTKFRATQSFDYDASAERNGNWRRRCGCNQFDSCNTLQWGQSYITFNNQSGRYKLRFHLRSYGKDYWWRPERTFDQNWNWFINPYSSYVRFDSGIIGPRSSGGGYFYNGNNNTKGGQAGTIGVEVFDSNNTLVRRILFWPATWTNWGTLWMRCGHDYNFNFFEV